MNLILIESLTNKTTFKWYDWAVLVYRTIVFISVSYNVMSIKDRLPLPDWFIFITIILSYFVPFVLLQRNRLSYTLSEMFFLAALTPVLAKWDATAAGNFVSYAMMLGFYLDRPSRRWSISLAIIILMAGPVTVIHDSFISYISIVISGFVFYGLGLMIHAFLHARQELQAKNEIIEMQYETLTQYAKQIEQNTVLQERNRISSELQQSISQTYSELIFQMETLNHQVRNLPAEESVSRLISDTRRGMQQIRDAIKQLQPLGVDMSLQQHIRLIIDDVQRVSSHIISFSLKGEEPLLSNQVKLTFVRCLQEMLTSAIQVGSAETLGVTLSFAGGMIEMQVEDDGKGNESERLESGLTRVSEQIVLMKGEFAITPFLNKGMRAICKLEAQDLRQEGSIKVVVVDDNPLFRESTVTLLSLQPDIEMMGETGLVMEALALCEEKCPDIVLLHVRSDEVDGFEGSRLTRQIKEISATIKIIITTSQDDIEQAVESIHAGAEGYINRHTPFRELMNKIRLVHMGETIVSQSLAKQLIMKLRNTDQVQDQYMKWKQAYGLTDRETEVLRLLADGLKYKEISGKLFLAEGTVRNYISNIYSKLEVKDREEAMSKALPLR